MKPRFEITKRDSKTRARLGILTTSKGKIQTPSYVMVATHAAIKKVPSKKIKGTKTQLVISNTYHLWDRILKEKKESPYWVHKQLGINIPVMTDSGGFQVFSLGFGEKNKVGKILKSNGKEKGKIKREKIKITNEGVWFKMNGQEKFLGPKESMALQRKIGANMIFAFDECTSPLDSKSYNEKAMLRTHRWAKICLEQKLQPYQMLFGIIQGGMFKDLRIKSAKTIGAMNFDGIGIGGSFKKDQIVKVLRWIHPHLPEEKPRHLLGIGKVEDIFEAVENGIDLFDCVIPTREGRHGRIWTNKGTYDIRKSVYAKDKQPIEKGCLCHTCKKVSRKDLRALFKSQNPDSIDQGQSLASIHNMFFFNNLMENMRKAIAQNKYSSFKAKFFKNFQN